jgi:DsbC/DsbD-like thiol-disulfide interchange protein
MIPLRPRVAIVLAAALSLAPVGSRAESPVTATSSSSKATLQVGESAEVVVSVLLEPGWHLNSYEPGVDFLIPTKLEFELPEGIFVHDVTYPEPVLRKLKFAGDRELRVYEGAFAIRATLSYESSSAAPRELAALLRYQACNDTICKRPSILRLPLDVRVAAKQDVSASVAAEGVALEWQPFTTEAYDAARRRRAPFVLEFHADWCAPCREMEERTFRDPRVLAAGSDVSFLSVDMTEPDDFIERVLRSFRVHAAPTTIFFDSGGKEWHRRAGFIGPDEFAQLLREAGNDAKPGPRTGGDVKPI